MKKRKGKPDDSLGYIYITYDAEMGQNDPGYITRWDFQKKVSNRVSHFVRKLHKHFGIHKNVFEMTMNMNYSTGNKYFDIPENCCLSRDAIERMAVCIILLEPPLNEVSEFKDSCKKEGINFKGVIPAMTDKDFENMRTEFCKAFGPFGEYLTKDIKSIEVVNNLNKFYFNKFNTKKIRNIMTNNTTSYGGDFTIKPLTTSIDIITERQLIASWTRAGLTDGQIRKMLMLYLGEPAWMNLEKMYTCNMFNNIAEGLKFHSKSDFIEILIRCKGFGFVWKDDSALHNMKNLLAFYTPIWHQPAEGEMENMQDSQENMQSGGCYNIININKKKNIKKKNIINKDSAHQIANSAEYRQLVETTARALLAYVRTNPDAYANVVKPVNDATEKMMVGLYSDPDAACPTNIATNQFFNSYLYPYLLNNSNRMMSIHTKEGQSCWLKNLINQDFMQKKILQAIADTKVYLAQHPGEMIRQNRPFSKFEYQDPESKQRFYDTLLPDGSIAQHRIPLDAPPRPSDQTTWSKFTHEWKTEKAENTEKTQKMEKTEKMDKTEKM